MRKSGFLMLKALKSAPHLNDNQGRIMYKKGGNQKKGAKFGTFLYFLYIKKTPIIYNQDPIIYNQNFG